jgi:hypothetical protein
LPDEDKPGHDNKVVSSLMGCGNGASALIECHRARDPVEWRAAHRHGVLPPKAALSGWPLQGDWQFLIPFAFPPDVAHHAKTIGMQWSGASSGNHGRTGPS